MRRVCWASTRLRSMLARVGERLADRGLGDLAERDPPRLGRRDVRRPRRRARRSPRLRGRGRWRGRRCRPPWRPSSMSVDLLAPVVADDVLGGEVVVDVDAELALAGVLGQVADVAVGGEDAVVGAEVALDRPRLGRRFDDHQVLRHGRECSTGSCTDPARRPRPGLRRARREARAHPKGAAGRSKPRGCAGGSPRRSRGRRRRRLGRAGADRQRPRPARRPGARPRPQPLARPR